MNLKNILWVRNTGKILPSASVQENLFGLKLSGGGGVEKTETGNPVSIVTNKAQNALDLQIAFSPKQSGSGTPSPDNIRPIVPWTSLTLTKNGVDTSYSLGGTHYGGSLDVVTGELTVTHISIAFSDIPSANWRYSDNSGNWDNYLFFANIADRKNITTSICSSYDFVTGTEAKVPADSYILPTWNKYLYIRDDSLSSIADFLAARGNERLVYELATPITISLTPAEVALLAGNNTLATDGDEVTVTYMAKK